MGSTKPNPLAFFQVLISHEQRREMGLGIWEWSQMHWILRGRDAPFLPNTIFSKRPSPPPPPHTQKGTVSQDHETCQ